MWGETEGLILFWIALFVGRRVVRWQGGKGGRLVKWHIGKGGRVLRLQGEKGGRVGKTGEW